MFKIHNQNKEILKLVTHPNHLIKFKMSMGYQKQNKIIDLIKND
jgi:hypothetical protein